MPKQQSKVQRSSLLLCNGEQRSGVYQWPSDVIFTPYNIYSPNVDKDVLKKIYVDVRHDQNHIPPFSKTTRCPLARPRVITDSRHPAYGQAGLFATYDLPAHSRILSYCGLVCDGKLESNSSAYVLAFAEGLSIDSEKIGNESRFINDFRGIAVRPNAQFVMEYNSNNNSTKSTDDNGLRHVPLLPSGMAVFVMSQTIKRGTEITVTYGKGYWSKQ
jgi:hypothetical protein